MPRTPVGPEPVGYAAVTRERPATGEEATIEVTVTDEMLVDLGGRRIHPVYATAWMVRHVEEAGRAVIEPHLGPNEDATGYRIDLTHERSARVGDHLLVSARVSAIDDRSCETAVEVHGPAGRIGHGTLVQRYVAAGRLG
jgi:fluoroacetyl-CoA thioesterase